MILLKNTQYDRFAELVYGGPAALLVADNLEQNSQHNPAYKSLIALRSAIGLDPFWQPFHLNGTVSDPGSLRNIRLFIEQVLELAEKLERLDISNVQTELTKLQEVRRLLDKSKRLVYEHLDEIKTKTVELNPINITLYREIQAYFKHKVVKIYQFQSVLDQINEFRAEMSHLAELARTFDPSEIFVNQIYQWRHPLFQRVIFDEADSVKLGSQAFFGRFNWLVTSSLKSLLTG